MAKIKSEFDERNVKIIELSVDPVEDHVKWANDIKETQGFAPNFPLIGDADLKIAKLWGMLPSSANGDASRRTAADNQTVRNVFVIGPTIPLPPLRPAVAMVSCNHMVSRWCGAAGKGNAMPHYGFLARPIRPVLGRRRNFGSQRSRDRQPLAHMRGEQLGKILGVRGSVRRLSQNRQRDLQRLAVMRHAHDPDGAAIGRNIDGTIVMPWPSSASASSVAPPRFRPGRSVARRPAARRSKECVA